MKLKLGNDILDSRDVIEHWKELVAIKEGIDADIVECEETLKDALDALENAPDSQKERLEKNVEGAQVDLDITSTDLDRFFDNEDYHLWQQLVEEGEECSEWAYGESLILDSYFKQYTQDLIDDCFEIPKEMDSGNWPYRHYKLDISAAAYELRSDYASIEVGSYVYYIRSC